MKKINFLNTTNKIAISTIIFSCSLSLKAQLYEASPQNFSTGLSHQTVELGDLNGDTFIDAVISTSNSLYKTEIWLNDGNGFFNLHANIGSNVANYFTHLLDVENDGDLDILILNDESQNELFLNDGNGNFSFTSSLGGNTTSYSGMAVSADFDGDNDVDVALVRDEISISGSNIYIYKNNGLGSFTNTQTINVTDDGFGLTGGNYDNNGSFDLFFGPSNGNNKIFFNDGTGNFVDSGQSLSGNNSWFMKSIDIDDDGDIDVLSKGNTSSYIYTYKNDGNGGFSLFSTFNAGVTYYDYGFDLNYLNNDNYPDLIIGKYGAIQYFNDGNGNFIEDVNYPTGGFLSSPSTADVKIGLLNNDNKLDIFFSSRKVLFHNMCPSWYTPPAQELCVVTADSATASYNIVVWEKSGSIDNIDSFYVYREITLGSYQKIGAVHRDSLSIYKDLASNPNSTNYKYRLSVLDTCGSESPQGLYHNSIHLQYFGSGNFIWTLYEIEATANQVASYNFYRDDNGTGNFQLLQVVPGGNNSYTDVSYLTYPNAVYRVDVNWIGGHACTATKAINHNTTRSNKTSTVAGPTNTTNLLKNMLRLYPNPASSTVRLEGIPMDKIDVLEATGKMVLQYFPKTSSTDIYVANLAPGLYQIVIHTPAGLVTEKLMVE